MIPPKPIPVVLTRDEEAAGIESESAKFNPPAYGLWRESIVCFNSHALYFVASTSSNANSCTESGPE